MSPKEKVRANIYKALLEELKKLIAEDLKNEKK